MRRYLGIRTMVAGCLAFMPLLGISPDTDQAVAAPPPPEPIYRLRITIKTSSTSQALYLEPPSDFVTARVSEHLSGGTVGLGHFGAGPLSVSVSESSERVVVRYVVALTPDTASDLVFRSVKANSGRSTIMIANLNRASPEPIRSIRHKRSHGLVRTFRLSVKSVAARGPVPGTVPLNPRVYSFYYPWYQRSYWFGGAIARYNRNEQPYDSDDPEAIDRHIRQARTARIDGFISSWFGPGTMTDENLNVVFDRLPEHGFNVAVYFETLGESFTSKRAVADAFRYLFTNFTSRPQYARYRGDPVIYIYQPQSVLRPYDGSANPRYRRVWRSIFRTLRAEGYEFSTVASSADPRDLRVFDGLHLYGVRTSHGFNRQMSLIARAFAAIHGGKRRIWVVPVAPGYDDRHLEDRAGMLVPRNQGAHYRSQWQTAITIHADAAAVLSFNEWYETTNIEPNRRWGDLYLDITRRKAGSYK